jgi:hypothetical protein
MATDAGSFLAVSGAWAAIRNASQDTAWFVKLKSGHAAEEAGLGATERRIKA